MLAKLVLLALVIGVSLQSGEFCDNSAINSATYSYGQSCGGDRYISVENMTSVSQVLRCSGGVCNYVGLSSLQVGDVVEGFNGFTTVTSVSASTLATPTIMRGIIVSGRVRSNQDFTFFRNSIGVNPSTTLPSHVALGTESGSFSVAPPDCLFDCEYTQQYTINYDQFTILHNSVSTTLNSYDVNNWVNYGTINCNEEFKTLYYYPFESLFARVYGTDSATYLYVYSSNVYYEMLNVAVNALSSLYFDGQNIIYGYDYNVPACTSTVIDTASGYLVVNGILFEV